MLRGLTFQGEMPPMNLNSLRHAVWPALMATAAVTACSKQAPTETAFVRASVFGNGSNAILCTIGNASDFFLVGTASQPEPTAVPEGTDGLSVDCTVSPNGSSYNLQLNASQGGASIIITGTVNAGDPNATDPTFGGNVAGIFVHPMYGTFSDNNCSLYYKYGMPSNPIMQSERVSGGSIFAYVDCPNAQIMGGSFSGVQATGPDGGVETVTCDATASFVFQGCQQ
jgi:hypothetical protein